ncbi:hypothetical protein GF406_17475 [candidate division KSB1 bacterium]|nr:hypothetical protein [candidate division KSB1 bacterium]
MIKENSDLLSLIEVLLKDPLEFERIGGHDKIIESGLTYSHLRGLIKRIYDINENQLIETSNANSGMIGLLNSLSTGSRKRKFNHRVDRQKPGKTYFKIYVEGDSWFQFPVFQKDIIDWLNRNDDFLIYSDAYGGDWITNILYEQQYITALSTYSPNFFLISGGGNDLVGSHRLGIMVDRKSNYAKKKYQTISDIKSDLLNMVQKEMILTAQTFLNKEFYAIINLFKLQYSLLFSDLYHPKSKQKHIITITHGYDFPFPSPKRRFSIRYPLQPFLNSMVDSGNWLYTPLMVKGILNRDDQLAIMLAMIYEFGEMMSSFAKTYKNIYHVDSRGFAQTPRDWFDELHLKSHNFHKIARAYETIIRNHSSLKDKVIRTAKAQPLKTE